MLLISELALSTSTPISLSIFFLSAVDSCILVNLIVPLKDTYLLFECLEQLCKLAKTQFNDTDLVVDSIFSFNLRQGWLF